MSRHGPLWIAPSITGDDPVPETCDDVVIGAGIVGLTTALQLARAGRDVCVVEARRVGAGNTGHSSAKVSLLQGTRFSQLLEHHDLDVVRAYAEANRDGFDWISAFCKDHDVVHDRRPAATFAATPDQVPRARAEFIAAEALGLPVAWHEDLDVPFPVHGATLLADQVQVDPSSLLTALASRCRAHGVRLVEGARVRHVDLVGSPRVRLADGRRIKPHTVVVATGATILDRSGVFADTEANRSYVVAYRSPEAPRVMALSAGSPTISVRDATAPDGSTALLVGGHGHVVGRTDSELDHLDAIRAWTSQHFPGAEEITAWSAQDRTTSDGLPRIGTLPGSPRIRHATGFAKWGFTNGTAAALAIAADILGDPLAWHATIEAGRPPGVTARLRFSINASVARELVSGYVDAATTGPASPAPGEGTVRREGARLVAEARDEDGEHRVSPICTHLGGVLKWNDAENSWDCPLHGSRFSADGEVLDGPATRPLPCLRERERRAT